MRLAHADDKSSTESFACSRAQNRRNHDDFTTMRAITNHIRFDATSFDKWFAKNYLTLVTAIGLKDADCLHDAFLELRDKHLSRIDYTQQTIDAYNRYKQKAINTSFKSFNPDPLFWLFQCDTLIDDDNDGDIDFVSLKRSIIAYVKRALDEFEREILLMKLNTGANNQDIADCMGVSVKEISLHLRLAVAKVKQNYKFRTA